MGWGGVFHKEQGIERTERQMQAVYLPSRAACIRQTTVVARATQQGQH